MSSDDVRGGFYDRYWRDESVTDSPHQRWKIQVLTEVLGHLRFASVLDVGAGDGALLSRVAPSSVRRVGAELADVALQKMGERGLEAVKVDLEYGHLPFGDGEFDVVMCLDVLEHVFDPERLLAELRRVTASAGHVVICVPNAFNLATRVAYALGRHVDVMDVAHRTGALFSEHIRFFSEALLDRMLAAGDLEVAVRRYYFPSELSDVPFARWAARIVTLPRLHERLPAFFALGFLVVCRRVTKA